jgi:hypothetical protein
LARNLFPQVIHLKGYQEQWNYVMYKSAVLVVGSVAKGVL